MKTKAILFNSPKQLGKTCAMNYLTDELLGRHYYKYLSCKTPLHNAVMAFFNIDPDTYFNIYESSQGKETPSKYFKVKLRWADFYELSNLSGTIYVESKPLFNESRYVLLLSLRQAMIYISEMVMKPALGEDVFGRYRADMIEDNYDVIIDDSTAAFDVDGTIKADELPPLIDKLGQENILLLRLHRDGFTFNNDSRCYVPDNVIDNTKDLYNNSDEESFYKEVAKVCLDFLEESSDEG